MNGKKAKALRKLAGNPGRLHRGEMEYTHTGSLEFKSGGFRNSYKKSKQRLGKNGDGNAVHAWRGLRKMKRDGLL